MNYIIPMQIKTKISETKKNWKFDAPKFYENEISENLWKSLRIDQNHTNCNVSEVCPIPTSDRDKYIWKSLKTMCRAKFGPSEFPRIEIYGNLWKYMGRVASFFWPIIPCSGQLHSKTVVLFKVTGSSAERITSFLCFTGLFQFWIFAMQNPRSLIFILEGT